MNALARQLEIDRSARDAAKAMFDARYGALKTDYEARGLTGRILDEVTEQAADMLDEAVAVVEEHPVAVGGTFTALVLWLLRNPIKAGIERLFGSGKHT
ncbi:hypothetical protein [Novosphingobium lindaniclasticum]|uniref:Uncharacterized protein n=1 Tax=Novosphingobium lindaniclasticum LE124 TaxID=1096930 RepID=T0HA33_9SPHN|nr:hypothetical protein [Novosphingobium lindaniclasticum]EQB08993.1 hypothetical protein L284_20315 [Novosphingobium lindaniclasticum LE124]